MAYNYSYYTVDFPASYVAHVQINRPEKLNAFIPDMWTNLGSIFTQLSSDPNVRAVVLSGKGPKAFTAGLDVQAAASGGALKGNPSLDAARNALPLRQHILEIQAAAATSIEKCLKPVIVVCHGFSFGMAIDMATACDVRIAVEGVKFSVKETEIGLAADVGTLTRIPKLGVSLSWVKDICYTSRIFGAEEALRVGFVSHIAKTQEEGLKTAVALASNMAEKSPVALVGTKHLIDYSKDRLTQEGLEHTALWNSVMLQTEDVPKAMMSGLKRQKPTFSKL